MPEKTLHYQNPRHMEQLYCGRPDYLKKAENELGVKLVSREDWISITGNEANIEKAETLFNLLDEGRKQGMKIAKSDFLNMLNSISEGKNDDIRHLFSDSSVVFKFHKKSIVPKTLNQKRYVKAIQENEIVFGVGPAGTGKTYLAVAAALAAITREEVDKLILTRPAVEAGEALGFLPGDLQEKIQPYLRPLYDAMFDMLGREYAQRLIDKEAIEIAPLAYMRGRTLSNAFIILDEAQNTTPEQMMMFLTRMGQGSRVVITGDITQIDLPRHKYSGLKEAINVLHKVDGIVFHYFEAGDVVRNPLVQKIIDAYQQYADETGAHQRRETKNL